MENYLLSMVRIVALALESYATHAVFDLISGQWKYVVNTHQLNHEYRLSNIPFIISNLRTIYSYLHEVVKVEVVYRISFIIN